MQTGIPIANEFEHIARLRKVAAMVRVIDRAARRKGIDPQLDAHRILDAFTRWTEQDWARVDRIAELKTKSSAVTRSQVIDEYKKRDELPF